MASQVDSVKNWNLWETFTLEYQGDGLFALRTIHGMYLSAKPEGSIVQMNWVTEWETFQLERRRGNFAIKTCHGTYLGSIWGYFYQKNWALHWEMFRLFRFDRTIIPTNVSNAELHKLEIGIMNFHGYYLRAIEQ